MSIAASSPVLRLTISLRSPRPLNMPSHEEITAMEHLDVLKMNGFEVVVDEEADVGQRVKLKAQPVSKDTVFGVEGTFLLPLPCCQADPLFSDLEELLDLINSRSAGEMVRPSKARKMFASRACRKSVMIGKALNVNQMTTVRSVLRVPSQEARSRAFVPGRAAYGRNGSTLGRQLLAVLQMPSILINLLLRRPVHMDVPRCDG